MEAFEYFANEKFGNRVNTWYCSRMPMYTNVNGDKDLNFGCAEESDVCKCWVVPGVFCAHQR